MAPPPKSPVLYLVEDRGYETPCFIWQRATTGAGYGALRDGPRVVLAHRHFYERRHGPIAPGLKLDHLCRQTLCVNPEHVEPVRQAINVRRGRAAKLTEQAVEEIRRRLAIGDRPDAIALDHGVVPDHVRAIGGHRRRRPAWAEGAL